MPSEDESFSLLCEEVCRWREAGQRIILCHGCFDPLHVGHLRHFTAARRHADRLVVTVTADRHINKGPDRPMFGQDLRLELVRALRVVDSAAINPTDSAVETIARLRPHFFAKGADYRNRATCNPNFFREEDEIRRIGGSVVYTDEPAFSSSRLIQCLLSRTASA